MPKQRSASSVGRLIMVLRALWNFYWYVVVQGFLWLDGWLKDRKRRKRETKTEGPKRKEHPRTARLRKEMEREKRRKDKERERPK